jgi:excisionase family DNA binding protein
MNETVVSLDDALRRLLREVVREVVREELRVRADPGPPMPGESGFVSVRKAAAMAGVNASSIRSWIAKGWIPGYRAGRLTRVRIPDLLQFMASGPPRDGKKIEPQTVVAEILERQRRRG